MKAISRELEAAEGPDPVATVESFDIYSRLNRLRRLIVAELHRSPKSKDIEMMLKAERELAAQFALVVETL